MNKQREQYLDRNLDVLFHHCLATSKAVVSAQDAAYDAPHCCHTDDLDATLAELEEERRGNRRAYEVANHYLAEAVETRKALGLPYRFRDL